MKRRNRKKRRIARKPKKLFFNFFRASNIITVAFLFLVAVANFPQIIRFYTSSSFTALTIPNISQTYLPPPLEFPPYSATILGLQKFDAKDIVKYVNIERVKNGAPPLRISPTLMKAAQMRADVILRYQNFSHQDPFEGIELTTVLPKLNYRYRYASENIGMGGVSGESFVFGFMNSTSHRENLLNPYLSDTGVAVVTGPYKQYYVNIAVQLFAIPGGKKEYLGYSDKEKEKYKKLLIKADEKLNPILWTINKFLGNKSYTDERRQKLIRQREILRSIYEVMKDEKPLQNKHIAMMMEYNKGLE